MVSDSSGVQSPRDRQGEIPAPQLSSNSLICFESYRLYLHSIVPGAPRSLIVKLLSFA